MEKLNYASHSNKRTVIPQTNTRLAPTRNISVSKTELFYFLLATPIPGTGAARDAHNPKSFFWKEPRFSLLALAEVFFCKARRRFLHKNDIFGNSLTKYLHRYKVCDTSGIRIAIANIYTRLHRLVAALVPEIACRGFIGKKNDFIC